MWLKYVICLMIAQEIIKGGIDMGYSVGLVSLGCDKNRIDAEIMLSILSKNGYEVVNDESKADVIIINTCGFIESAKEESIETILEMAQNKENGACKSIIVTGCMAERYKDELIKEMPEVNAIVGTGSYKDICEIVTRTLEGENGIIKADDINYSLDYSERILTTPSHYAYVKIAEGCDNSCSYCIIPKLRGRFRSRRIEDIIKEVTELSNKGIKEIILVAQDTTMYGTDIYSRKMLPELIREIENIEGIEWIRLMYTYPEEITEELIMTVKNSSKVCHYFDMPMQHINTRILNSMKRKSTKEKIIRVIDLIRSEIPDAVIRTSLIVGFPGEDDEAFEELKEFLTEYKLDRVGVFTYSPEEGTEAAYEKNQVEQEVKEKRRDILMQVQGKISHNRNKMLIDRVFDVIIDGSTKNNQYYGRTYADAPEIDQQVFVNSELKLKKGDIVKVKITKSYMYDLIGDVVNESC